MRRLLADDTVAFSVMYDRHVRAVYGLALRAPERGTAATWLMTITRNRAIDVIRRGRGHRHVGLDGDDECEAPDRTDEQALRHVEVGIIGVALRTLPDAQRRVLELGYFDGLSHREIATRLQVPLGTVKGRMRLGLNKLAGVVDPPATTLN